ncbi:MAG: amidohydrolase [Lachnospiraceae bacterium]|nr:amidohydrolase [Lachnospiraceae bacterium]MBQ2105650.1 amidohydrolase [Lachnospiraceae bacterium]MBQ2400448.1 amidohydrolase [Lachnospiraceae bacterium]MBQ2404306.1 amidohydrolase [Lachnospiraceae bacterium]MBQ2425117.1 amidohydrolase [Lachnospiraceae bacterium]
MSKVVESAKAMMPELIAIRRHFHMYPENSRCEKETSAKVIELLKEMGVDEIIENVNGYGVIGVIKGANEGGVVGIRADMDALQVQEMNDVEFKSRNEGCMHACGHDAHTAGLIGAGKILCQNRDMINGTVKLIFQPAEELSPYGGSKGMLESGHLDDVQAVYGLHVWPDLPHGKVGIKAGPLMAATDHFTINIHGKGAHGAKPDQGIDAVVLGAQFVMNAQTFVSRKVSPLDNAVVTFGIFNAGTRYNVIAGDCLLDGTVRTFNPDTRDMIEDSMRKLLDALCLQTGCTAEIEYGRGYPALMNHEKDAALIRETAVNLFGEEEVVDVALPAMPAEDFSYYLVEKEGCFVWLGSDTTPEGETAWPLHNSRFNIDEDLLWRGSSLLAQVAIDYLNK